MLQKFSLLVSDLGGQVPADLWRNYDYAIITFDLTGKTEDFEPVWTLIRECFDTCHDTHRLVVVGTKRDLVPPNPYDTAVLVHGRARDVAYRYPGLGMLGVSSLQGTGYSELIAHIGTSTDPICEMNLMVYLQ